MTKVVAALIFDGNGRFMICQRPAHKKRGLLWEFVGGKTEPGESKEKALIRECREELDVDIIAGAALMTTTMPAQRDIITLLKEEGIRDQFKCMFGGAPVSPEWVESIGADAYAENAAEAVAKAKELMEQIRAGA